MTTENSTTTNDDTVVTTEDMARAASRLGLPKEALASIFEQAFFAVHSAGLRYENEAWDLCEVISKGGAYFSDEMHLRLLAMPFDYTNLIRDTVEEPAPLRAAAIDLIRAVAVFYVRKMAYWQAHEELTEANGGREAVQ